MSDRSVSAILKRPLWDQLRTKEKESREKDITIHHYFIAFSLTFMVNLWISQHHANNPIRFVICLIHVIVSARLRARSVSVKTISSTVGPFSVSHIDLSQFHQEAGFDITPTYVDQISHISMHSGPDCTYTHIFYFILCFFSDKFPRKWSDSWMLFDSGLFGRYEKIQRRN